MHMQKNCLPETVDISAVNLKKKKKKKKKGHTC